MFAHPQLHPQPPCVSLAKWCTEVWRPTEAIASSVGDEFETRAKHAGVFVDHDGDPDRSLDKGRKIDGLGAPTTTLTSSNKLHFVDDRSSDPLHVGVRQLEFSEVLQISGFDDDLNATAFLKSRSEEDALKLSHQSFLRRLCITSIARS